jgi:hypothetical protein
LITGTLVWGFGDLVGSLLSLVLAMPALLGI